MEAPGAFFLRSMIMKLKTTGNFMLVCAASGVEFEPGVPTEVTNLTSFLEERLALGQLVDCTDEAEAPAPAPAPEPEVEDNDKDDDGHHDKTGEFVEGNKEAAKPRRKAKGRK